MVGSSLLRGAARVLTGVPHYFSEYEENARANPDALSYGQSLLDALAASLPLDADAWSTCAGLAPRGFAGRGLKAKPTEAPQILATLKSGEITMPLWGLSLDRSVAQSYGSHFLFEVVGPFPAIASWTYSGIKPEEQELIAGGRYDVIDMTGDEDATHVQLRWAAACRA